MIVLAWYLLKVIICSALLFGYYFIALRNKIFHQWNRYYLLSAVVLSLLLPVIKINIWQPDKDQGEVVRLLTTVSQTDEFVAEAYATSAFSFTTGQVLLFIYAIVSLVLLTICLRSVVTIFKIIRSYPKQTIGDISFVDSDAKGTPFSFMNFIVWNRNIDINSETGRQIFQHEVVHVKEKHTLDKVFMLVVLIFFWINPFFWLIRRELNAIHEFIADDKAVNKGDTEAFVQMILTTVYPKHNYMLTNSFFHTSIKRRLLMFTKQQNPRINYFSRLLCLPILFLVATAFTLKVQNTGPAPLKLERTIIVVIDPGHGKRNTGGYYGAEAGGVYEDDVVLQLAKTIKELNRNDKVKIILTRTTDDHVDLKSRVTLAERSNADLFISLHTNAVPLNQGENLSETPSAGIEVYVPTSNPQYQLESEMLGSILIQELSNVHYTFPKLLQRKNKPFVLDQNVCPSVIIECGYITNNKDRNFIINPENQKAIAQKILNAIERYAQNAEGSKNKRVQVAADTVPDQIEQQKQSSFTMKTISLEEAKKYNALLLIDNKVFAGTINNLPISPKEIAYIAVLRGSAMVKEFGENAKDGVIVITTKKYSKQLKEKRTTDSEPVFQKVEVDPTFPGGKEEWKNFLQKNLNASTPVDNGSPVGAYTVVAQFIVDKDGNILDLKTLTTHGYGMEAEVERMMKLSPKWIPAKQNGKAVSAYVKQPVTFVIANGDGDANSTGNDNRSPTVGAFEISATDFKKLTVKQITQRNTNHDVISFSFIIEKADTYFEVDNKGNELNQQIRGYIESVKPGDFVTVERIKVNVNGDEKRLPSLAYNIK